MQVQPIVVLIFNCIILSLSALLFTRSYKSQNSRVEWLGLLAALFTLTTLQQLAQFYVSCRDPGFINPKTFNRHEASLLLKDTVKDNLGSFRSCLIYKPRLCTTCKIYRPPYASHCKFCNACVLNFDHHCTVINQCIGVRNHRAFFICLMLAFLNFLLLFTIGLYSIIY